MGGVDYYDILDYIAERKEYYALCGLPDDKGDEFAHMDAYEKYEHDFEEILQY